MKTTKKLNEGLLADTETRVVYGQPASEVDQARELLGLSDTEAKLLPHLPRARPCGRSEPAPSSSNTDCPPARSPSSTRTPG